MRAIPPGAHLRESRLAEAFGVSRSIIRRALQRLHHEGIVDIRPNKGASVVQLGRAEARAICEARGVLEVALVRLAAQHCDESDAQALRTIATREAQYFENNDRGHGLLLSAQFHEKIAHMSGNDVLHGYAKNLLSRSALVVAQYERREPEHCTHSEHHALIDAIAAHDADTACTLMRQHLESIESKLDLREAESEIDWDALLEHLNTTAPSPLKLA